MKKIFSLASCLLLAARLFAQTDTLPPTVICINGLSLNLPSSKMVTLWAGDLLQYATDDQTPPNQIKIALRKKGTGTGFPLNAVGLPNTSIIFNCSELGQHTVELWARDLSGNAAKCEMNVLVKDNTYACQGGNNILTACAKTPCQGAGVEDATFELRQTDPNFPVFYRLNTTDNAGCSYWNLPIPIAGTLELSASNDNPFSFGITLSKIDAHIKGTAPFVKPWQWVAADADRNGVVDTLDIIVCRKWQLGIYTEPPHGAWRFFPSDHVFPMGNPLSLPIPSSITLGPLNAPLTVSFDAVRVCNVACASLSGTEDYVFENQLIAALPYPNPTSGGTALGLYLAQPETVTVEVADLSGRVLYRAETQQPVGEQTLEVPAAAFPQAGVYVWRVLAGGSVQVGKVLRF